uniref:Prolactin n=1 Tax=Scleropages formosus TaxID=113540 RepID=A0A8C9WLQ9_SCLFO
NAEGGKGNTPDGIPVDSVLLSLFVHCHCVDFGDLMDRAVQLSDKVHFLSTSLKSDLDYHLPAVGKKIPHLSLCHTSPLKTPMDKNQVLSLSESELLSLVQSLLLSWTDALLLLSSEASSLPHPSTSTIQVKAKQLRENSDTLGTGLSRLAHKMGSSSSSYIPLRYTENSLGGDDDSRLVNFHFLLSCFRRDSHKIDNFLKILRCRANKQKPDMC